MDPVPDPEAALGELVPEEPEADEPVTCWPTVRLTEATVPAIVEVSVASANAFWALVTCVSATSTLASSEAIWAAEAPSAWSEDSCA